jgi:hypothetical protein
MVHMYKCSLVKSSFGCTLQGETLHPPVVLLTVVLVEGQRLLLGWTIDVGLVFQQLLDAQQNLLDGYVGLPVFLFVQNR